jgi:hypothetical protein
VPAGPARRLLDGLVRDALGADRAALVARDATGLQLRLLRAADAVRAPGAGAQDGLRAAREVCRLLAQLGAAGRARTKGPPLLDVVGGASEPDGQPGHGRRGGEGGHHGDGDGDGDGGGGDDDGGQPGHDAVDAHGAGAGRDEDGGPARRPAGGHGPRAAAARSASGPSASTGGGSPGSAGSTGDAPVDAATDADHAPQAAARPAAPRRPAAAGPHSVLHDEWDYIGRRYLSAWCRVNEHRLRGDAPDFIADVRRRHPDLARRIRSRFAVARPRDRRRMPRVVDGDDLDLDSLVEGIADRRAGHGGELRPYLRRDPQERTVAAAFLVDMSASTGLPLPDPAPPVPPASACDPSDPRDPDPRGTVDRGAMLYGLYDDPPDPGPRAPRRRVIDVAKDALALMSDALAALGDAHAIYGFSGNGRHDVEFHVAKDFADAVSPASWAAIAAIEPRGSTRMGAAIRHAAARLARQPARQRLLMVVSDGYPQDVDYGPDRGDEAYGIHDTARALQEAARAGIATFCVTIDPAGHDYLRAMCAERAYLVIDDVDALPAALAKVYLGLTDRG